MKKNYMKPLCETIELDNEESIMLAASGVMTMDKNTKVDQLSNQKDMWGNENVWK